MDLGETIVAQPHLNTDAGGSLLDGYLHDSVKHTHIIIGIDFVRFATVNIHAIGVVDFIIASVHMVARLLERVDGVVVIG